VQIPHDLMLSYEVAKSSPIGRALTNCTLRSSHTWIAAYLLVERAKGSASKWAPYISIFPETFKSKPIHLEEQVSHRPQPFSL
jgi:hypothetical protein